MNEREIFTAAAHEQDSAQRAAVLERACGDNHELRRRVELLLAEHAAQDSFLDRPAVVATLDLPASERPGQQIGPYRLLQQIGEGGFGIVFMAEQTGPVRRRVALKVIKPGMDSRQVIARFEAERQALAVMDHPNIAKVLDAGTIGEMRNAEFGMRSDEPPDFIPHSAIRTPQLLRRVVATLAEWVAAEDAPQAQRHAAEHAVLLDGPDHVVAARRLEAALAAEERAERELVDAHGENHGAGGQAGDFAEEPHLIGSHLSLVTCHLSFVICQWSVVL
jgi:hypothetical protein